TFGKRMLTVTAFGPRAPERVSFPTYCWTARSARSTVTVTLDVPVSPALRLTASQSESDASVQRPLAVTVIVVELVPSNEMNAGLTVMLVACGWPPLLPVGSHAANSRAETRRIRARRDWVRARRMGPPREDVMQDANPVPLTHF